MSEEESVLVAEGLHHGFVQDAGKKLEILNNLNLDVHRGESVAILGHSGSGKSTLLSLLAGLDHPHQGEVTLAGRNLQEMSEEALTIYRAAHLSIIFQQFHLVGHLSALENVMLPLEIRKDPRFLEKGDEALRRVGLLDRAGHRPSQLSGGEKQRIALARAWITEPDVVLADEPSGNLDEATGNRVMDLLFDLVKEKNTALVLVTHNSDLAKRCSRILHLKGGALVS